MTRGSISFKHLRIVEQTIIRRKTLATDFEFAQSLVRRAGELIKKSVSAGGYTSAWKDDNTPVTSIDIAVNKLVISELGRQYPQDRVYGEEESADAETPSGMTWVLDPIDGTQALEQGIDAFTCCLARLDAGGQPLFSLIYNPSKDQLFAARRGEAATLNGTEVIVSGKDNIKGSKVLNLRAIAFGCTQVAAGLAEGAYIGVKTPFEAASATLIVEGAGGHVTDLYGNAPGRLDGEIKGLVVSNGLIHNDLLGALR
jgi:myo-inositol-1(or 4)-monophosphatase